MPTIKYLIKNMPFEIERAFVHTFYKTFKLRPSSLPFLAGDTYRAFADNIYDETKKCSATDIKKNNDYAMWLKISHKTDCYLLPEVLAMYRRGRSGSISTHGYVTLLKWHYKLFHEANGNNIIQSIWFTLCNMLFGLYKKFRYVKRYKVYTAQIDF